MMYSGQILLFIIGFTANIIAEVEIKCSNIDEYFFAKPGSFCTTYYKCANQNEPELKECDPGSMFDFYSQNCTRNAGICYEPICTGRTDGIYADTTHACRRSLRCQFGRLISVDNCPQSHLHNGKRCVNQDLVMCDLPHTTAISHPFVGDQRCIGREDGKYGMDNCYKYIVCHNQHVTEVKSCPNGQKFQNQTQNCVLESQVAHCTDIDEYDIFYNNCKHLKNGHYADPKSTDCSSYIMCKDGKFISKHRCGNSAVFNGALCVPSPLYTCPFSNGNHNMCKAKHNGFYSNPIQGCSAYIRCMSGRVVETKQCPEGQYFNPEEKNCIFEKFIERQMCIEPKQSLDCDSKPEGFYQGTKCQTYFYCWNGYKTEYKCSNGKLFDGENCVSAASYNCPSEQNSCKFKIDGYYKNDDGSCRSYYYCSNGLKTTYLCEIGHYFNGIKCVQGIGCNETVNEICYGKPDGYYADLNSNCRNFVYCDREQKINEFTCPGSKIYNGNKCINSNLYACPSEENYQQLNCVPKKCKKMDCTHQMNAFYMDLESECKNYFFCIDGKKSSLSCPEGQLFNGEICVPQKKFTCPVYCLNDNEDENTSKLENLHCVH